MARYKVKNPYGEYNQMDLNLMGCHRYRRSQFHFSEIVITVLPLILCGFIFMSAVSPDIGFLAECQNIPGGDICSISIK